MNGDDQSVNATPDPVNKPAPPRAAAEVTDEEFAATLTDTIPGTHNDEGELPLGTAVYQAIMRAIAHERARCAGICLSVRNKALNTGRFALMVVGNYQAANQGDSPDAVAAAGAAEQSNLLAQAFNGVANKIRRPPGSCKACGGTKKVASAQIATADGRPHLVECPACKAAAPAPAEVSG